MLRKLFPEMESLEIYVIPGTPFLYFSRRKTLVMADLHLGFEEAAARGLEYSLRGKSGYSGIFLPRIQFRKILEMLNYVLEHISVERVIVNGDLKHAFDRLLRQEKIEVRSLLKHFKERGISEFLLVRGNHDNFVRNIVKGEGGNIANALSVPENNAQVFITHGHEYFPSEEYNIVVIGHEHPSLKCFGGRRFPVFQKIPLDKDKWLVIMPATGPYHPGTQVSPNPDDYLSPYVKKAGLLYKSKILLWIEIEKGEEIVEQMSTVLESPLLRIDRLVFGGKEYALIEFADLETASILCSYE
ncbi:metallophosphoesterase [Thermosphaera chiliense]|nr:metallophosphoesterase [Thermosphaera aggregans]